MEERELTLVFYPGGSGGDHHFNLVVEMGKRLDNIKSKNNENQIIYLTSFFSHHFPVPD